MIDDSGHEKSRQAIVPGADHYFTGQGSLLVNLVADWLGQLD